MYFLYFKISDEKEFLRRKNYIHVRIIYKYDCEFNFIVETIQTNPQLFADGLNIPNLQFLRRLSDISLQSTMSGIIDNVPLQAVTARK